VLARLGRQAQAGVVSQEITMPISAVEKGDLLSEVDAGKSAHRLLQGPGAPSSEHVIPMPLGKRAGGVTTCGEPMRVHEEERSSHVLGRNGGRHPDPRDAVMPSRADGETRI